MSKTVIVQNKTHEEMRLMLEPLGEVYDIPPNVEVEIRGGRRLTDGLRIELYPENTVSVWVPFDVDVLCNQEVVQPS
ncbi:MAG: hypothetical protein QOJ94_2439 [Sphingomonadales bacterium]|jgi:hypothetical protein|nr:hypothetical protein [Sphingomonadales bacterium]